MTELPLEWRGYTEDDRNYVLSSWLRSYAESPEMSHLAPGVYFSLYEPHVKGMLERCFVAVAGLPDLPDVVVGWLAIEDGVLHYAHTKPRFRRMGVARWMLRDMKHMPITYTHQPSRIALRLVEKDWTYDPMRRFERKAA